MDDDSVQKNSRVLLLVQGAIGLTWVRAADALSSLARPRWESRSWQAPWWVSWPSPRV